MQTIYRDLLKHSSIYGLGLILARLASILLLPLYTKYLSPRDYGVIAILDLTGSILAILITTSMSQAVARRHFATENAQEQDHVWWTGLTCLMLIATCIVGSAWIGRDIITHFTLGPQETQGSFYYALALPALWVNAMSGFFENHLRVQKRSSLIVALSLLRLFLNVGFNVYFLVILDMKIAGVLLGNLITGFLMSCVLFLFFVANRGRYGFRWELMRSLLQFGTPFVINALLLLVINQADRYILLLFLDLDTVGIYSLAYTIGQGMNILFFRPFNTIWDIVLYEIASLHNAKRIYQQIFKYSTYASILLMFGASLFIKHVLAILTNQQYIGAARLVPIICLSYVFASLHTHFKVPVMLSKSTKSLIPVSFYAAFMTVASNLILVPLFGEMGAAWANSFTTITYSFTGLWIYSKIDKYEYPLWRCGVILLCVVTTYIVMQPILAQPSYWVSVGLPALIWIAWFVILLGPITRKILIGYRSGNPLVPR